MNTPKTKDKRRKPRTIRVSHEEYMAAITRGVDKNLYGVITKPDCKPNGDSVRIPFIQELKECAE